MMRHHNDSRLEIGSESLITNLHIYIFQRDKRQKDNILSIKMISRMKKFTS